MARLIVTFIVVSALAGHSRADSISSDFKIQKLTFKNHKPTRGQWVDRTSVVAKNEHHILVGASWCHFTLAVLKAMSKDPKLSAKFDLVLLFDDEIPTVVDIEKREAGEAKAKEIGKELRRRGLTLIDAKAVDLKLQQLYLVKEASVEKLVHGFPSVLKCVGARCTTADDDVVGAINPILLEEAKHSE